MIRILIDHDRISIPNPIRDVGKIFRSNAKVSALEPESIRTTAFEAEDVTGPEAQCKASVFPGSIQVVACIVTTHIVPDPLAVVMNVGHIWMSLLIAKITLASGTLVGSLPLLLGSLALFRSPLLLYWSLALFGSPLLLHRSLPLLGSPLLRSLPGSRSRTTRRNISATNPTLIPVVSPAMLLAAAVPLLRNARNRKARRE